MTVTLTLTAADGATKQIVLADPVVNAASAPIVPVAGQMASVALGSVKGGSLSLPNAPTPGNCIVVGVVAGSTSVTLSGNDGAGHNYTITPSSPIAANSQTVAVFYLPSLPSGTSKTFVLSSSLTADTNMWIAEFSGVAASSVIDIEAVHTSSASSTTVNDPTLTTTSNGDLLFTVIAATGDISAANNPWHLIGSPENGNAAGYMVQSAHGTQAINFTQSPAATWTAIVAAFKAAGSSPPPPQAPVVSNGSFTLQLPAISGAAVGTMTATNSPTSWAITAGNASGYFAIDNSGNITVTAAGASSLAAGTDTLTCQATNSAGNGSGTATTTINAAGTGGYNNLTNWPSAANRPSVSGSTLTWIGPSLTGGPSTANDQTLTRTLTNSGSVTLSTSGQVVQGLNISGDVTFSAPNTICRQCVISGTVHGNGGSGPYLLEDCLINGGGPGVTAIWPGNPTNTLLTGTMTVRRCQVSGYGDAISISRGPLTVVDNYFHNFTDGGNPSANHVNGIQHNGGNLGQIDIEHNCIQNQLGQTDCIMLDDVFGAISNVKVNNNLLQGGGDFTLYLDLHFQGTTPTNIVVTNNAFQITGSFFANGYHDFNPHYPNTFSGNFDFVTGAAVT